jgi:hypothetical protein
MASRTFAADDFASIRTARDKILKDEDAARNAKPPVVSSSSSSAPQTKERPRAADDPTVGNRLAELRREAAESLKGKPPAA